MLVCACKLTSIITLWLLLLLYCSFVFLNILLWITFIFIIFPMAIIWSFLYSFPKFWYKSDWFCFSLPTLHIPYLLWGYGFINEDQTACIIILILPFSGGLTVFELAPSRYRTSVSLQPSMLVSGFRCCLLFLMDPVLQVHLGLFAW